MIKLRHFIALACLAPIWAGAQECSTTTPAAAIVDVTKDGSEGSVSFYFKSEGGCWYFRQYEVRVN